MGELYPGLGEPEGESFVYGTGEAPLPRDTVLVVSNTRITTIVVSRIVRMAGLKCLTTEPGGFDEALREPRLGAVILDDELPLAERVAQRAAPSPPGRPLQRPQVILLATGRALLEAGRNSPHCHAVLAKPVASDTLYPLLYDIRQRVVACGRT